MLVWHNWTGTKNVSFRKDQVRLRCWMEILGLEDVSTARLVLTQHPIEYNASDQQKQQHIRERLCKVVMKGKDMMFCLDQDPCSHSNFVLPWRCCGHLSEEVWSTKCPHKKHIEVRAVATQQLTCHQGYCLFVSDS